MLIAGKRLVLDAGDVREPGDPVPEAAGWRHLRPWLRSGHVLDVPDETDGDVPNPRSLSVSRVLQLVTEHPDWAEEILRMEANGRNRAGIVRELTSLVTG